MEMEEYRRHPGVSRSFLWSVLRSPAHARHGAFNATRAMEIGTAIHAALLEPERYATEYRVGGEDRRSKAYKAAVEAAGSKDLALSAPEGRLVEGMQAACYRHAVAGPLLREEGECESSVFATDPETGIQVKIRPDKLGKSGILDVKKTQDARSWAFARTVAKYGYHFQAAFYTDVWQWHTGDQIPFRFLAVEEQPPHGVGVFILDDLSIEVGRRLYRTALREYAECKASGLWPAYAEEEEIISVPEWELQTLDEEMV